MTMVNNVDIRFQNKSLTRLLQHGDRVLLDVDGRVIRNSLPADIETETGKAGPSGEVISFFINNFKEFTISIDQKKKYVDVEFIDICGNFMSAGLPIEETAAFIDHIIHHRRQRNPKYNVILEIINAEAFTKTALSFKPIWSKVINYR